MALAPGTRLGPYEIQAALFDDESAEADALFDRAVAIARAAGAAHITGLVLLGPKQMAHVAGDYEHALELIGESVALVRPLGKWILATALANVCDLALCLGRVDQGEKAGREGVVCAHETGDTRGMSWCLAVLARAAVAGQ